MTQDADGSAPVLGSVANVWIPVADRLPEKGVYVAALWALTETSSHERVFVVRKGVPGWYLQNGVEMTDPTHWMPLPEPPSDDK